MSAAAKKKDEELAPEAVDLPTDRELKLAKNFEDPALDELIPSFGQAGGEIALSVTEEAAAAVQELVQDAAEPDDSAAIDLSGDFSAEALELPLPEPAAHAAAPLPKTVNPDPDPLERSLLLSAAPDMEERSKSFTTLPAPGLEAAAAQNQALLKVTQELFELVVCERAFDELVLHGLRVIIDAVGGYTGSVLELDHEHEDFFFRASFGGTTSHAQLKAFRVPINKGIVGHVAESGQSLLIRNLAEDEKQMRAISVSVGFEAVTCMAAPILVAGQPYGVIEVFNKRDGSLFEERDLRVLEEGVRLLSKVLEVRFLMAELSRRVR